MAQLGLTPDQVAAVVRADAPPGVGGEVGVRRRRCRTAARGQIEGDDEAGARLDEFAAGDARAHVALRLMPGFSVRKVLTPFFPSPFRSPPPFSPLPSAWG